MGKASGLKPNHWTQPEIRQLKRLYPMSHNKDLAKIFGRTIMSILSKAKDLGIKKDWESGYRVPPPPQNENLWTKEDVAELRNMYLNSSDSAIAAKLKRTRQAVQAKARKLKLFKELSEKGLHRKTNGRNRWTDKEIALLKELYPVKRRAEIAQQLGRSRRGIDKMVTTLKLPHLMSPPSPSRKNSWPVADDAFLAEYITKWPIEKIAEKLGRTPTIVQRRAWKKHFLRNPEQPRTKQRPWTRQEILQLQHLLPTCSNKEIAEMLGRPLESILGKKKRMKIKRPPPWTEKNIAILKKYFPFETNAKVGERLGKDPGLVRLKAIALGLRKSIYAKLGLRKNIYAKYKQR